MDEASVCGMDLPVEVQVSLLSHSLSLFYSLSLFSLSLSSGAEGKFNCPPVRPLRLLQPLSSAMIPSHFEFSLFFPLCSFFRFFGPSFFQSPKCLFVFVCLPDENDRVSGYRSDRYPATGARAWKEARAAAIVWTCEANLIRCSVCVRAWRLCQPAHQRRVKSAF